MFGRLFDSRRSSRHTSRRSSRQSSGSRDSSDRDPYLNPEPGPSNAQDPPHQPIDPARQQLVGQWIDLLRQIVDSQDQQNAQQNRQPDTPSPIDPMIRMRTHPLGRVVIDLAAKINNLCAGGVGVQADPEAVNLEALADEFDNLLNDDQQAKVTLDSLGTDLQLFAAGQRAKNDQFENLMKSGNFQGMSLDIYNNPMFVLAEKPPRHFGTESKLKTTKDLIEAKKLFPSGSSRFTGEKNSTYQVGEFLKNMNEAQAFLDLTEKEFQDRLLGSTSGWAHEMVNHWIEKKYTTAQLYFNLHLLFNRQLSPQSAKEKLKAFKVRKNMSSAEAESFISKVALKASQEIPIGEARNSYYDFLCSTVYLDALPYRVSGFARSKLNDLAVQLGRQPSFSEFSQILDPHRFFLDQEIAREGAQPAKKEEKNQKGYFKKQVNYVGNQNFKKVDQGKNQGSKDNKKGQGQKGDREKKGQGKGKDKKERSQSKQSSSSYNDHNKKTFRQAGKPKVGQPGACSQDKWCSLCGHNGGHAAVEGCPAMTNEKGQVVGVTPCYGDCSICRRGLKHPESLCPFKDK